MITITENAKKRIIGILDENTSKILRFGLQGGGCSGFQYIFSLEENVAEDDTEYSIDDNHKVVVDYISHGYLEEVVLDYKKEISGEAFVVNNPSKKSQCGCGNSFSMD